MQTVLSILAFNLHLFRNAVFRAKEEVSLQTFGCEYRLSGELQSSVPVEGLLQFSHLGSVDG